MDTFLGFDAVMLARMQFGFTVAFHFIFPAFSIGLASFLAPPPSVGRRLPLL